MKYKFLIVQLLTVIVFTVNAQVNPTYTVYTKTFSGTSQLIAGANHTFSNINKVFSGAQLKQRNKSAKLRFKLDLGNDYVKTSANWNFTITADFNYQIGSGTALTKTVQISQTAPENIKIQDVLTDVSAIVGPTIPVVITINALTITGVTAGSLLQSYITSSIRLTVNVEREYEVDVRYSPSGLLSNPLVITPPTITSRLVTFSWQPSNVDAYPNYEVQILKLYNTDPAFQTNTNQISTTIDWTKALKVETQSFNKGIKLTMAEGTGYYMWRVRPIGTYYKGGIANSENYGEWSYALPTSTATSTFNKNALQTPNPAIPYAFYFTDPDENINWIYSRVFTEGDNANLNNPTGLKTSEGLNYANGLLMSRQSQKYNSSENTNIVSQSLIDYSGRPALTTIPVPVSGNLAGYKLGFVQNTSGVLYTAETFDSDLKLNNPDLIKSTGTPFSYYSNTASGVNNANVPDAEGYPFKRTIFKSDGSNRVSEETGVGKAHALGSQTSGMGRTTRILYCTPSDDELLRIFGDEAPTAESVIKTITIDQNNVSSVTYTSKEGKTIATSLITDASANLQNLKRAATTVTLTNSINENSSSGGSLVASKRIAITTNTTTIKLAYVNNMLPTTGTMCPTGSCNLKLRFYLTNLTNGIRYVSDADITTPGINNFNTSGGTLTFPANWRFVSIGGSSPSTLTPSGAGFNELTLNAGEYFFVKEIFSNNKSNYADSLVNNQNEKTKPVIDAIMAKMQTINSATAHAAFEQFLTDLKTKIDNYNGLSGTITVTSASLTTFLSIDLTALPAGYTFPTGADFNLNALTTNTADPTFSNLSITTGCCGPINVAIPKPPGCFVCDGNPSLLPASNPNITAMTAANTAASSSTIIPYGLNDFIANGSWNATTPANKINAISSLVQHEFITPLTDKLASENYTTNDLWKFAPGFSLSSLQTMLSNMLISQYYTGKSVKNITDNKWYPATYDATTGKYVLGATPVASLTNLPYNYDPKKLYDAWTSALELINAFELEGDGNILDGFNSQENEPKSGQKNADDDSNWEKQNIVTKTILKRKMSQELEEANDSDEGKVNPSRQEAASSFINQFLSEAGLQFAWIIDGSPLPDFIPATSGSPFPTDYSGTSFTSFPFPSGSGLSSITSSVAINGATLTNVPIVFSSTGVTSATPKIYTCSYPSPAPYKELYYPYVVKPEWQFKYFVYNVFNNSSFITDDNLMLPHQVSLDIQRLYNAPLSYFNVTPQNPLCSTPPASTYSTSTGATNTFTYTHLNWSLSERNSFYSFIKGAPKCPSNKGIPTNDPLYDPLGAIPNCPTKGDLYTDVMNELDYRISSVDDKKPQIRAAFQDELVSACYTIVPCKTGTGVGQITEKEINIMVDSVIFPTKRKLKQIKTNISSLITNTTTAVCCSSPGSFTLNYGNSLCQLPSSSRELCDEVVLYKNNQIGVNSSSKIIIQLFTDCDQKIMDMIQEGSFLPDIVSLPGCPAKPQKQWKNPNCLPANTTCGPSFTEKTTCSPSDYKSYSNTISVLKTGN